MEQPNPEYAKLLRKIKREEKKYRAVQTDGQELIRLYAAAAKMRGETPFQNK